jgi:hypothetical protein
MREVGAAEGRLSAHLLRAIQNGMKQGRSDDAVALFGVLACDQISQSSQQTLTLRPGDVEPVQVHDFRPRCYKVVHQLLLAVPRSVDFSQGSELGVRSKDQVDTGGGPL